jgi:hypothetical protein
VVYNFLQKKSSNIGFHVELLFLVKELRRGFTLLQNFAKKKLSLAYILIQQDNLEIYKCNKIKKGYNR